MDRIRRVRARGALPRAIIEKIKQRRSQMLIHSYLYYVMDSPVVSDHQWQLWADELEKLQQTHGAVIGFYDETFADWTGATGCHLPQDDWVARKALQILRYTDQQAFASRGVASKGRVRRIRA